MLAQAIILADGDRLPVAASRSIRKGRYCIALDGVAEQARLEGWRPDLIMGDFDTVKPATLKYFQRLGIEILRTPDQDYTDLEKALAWCSLRNFTSIWIAQAQGGRLDHSLETLALLKRYHRPRQEILLLTERERVRFLRNENWLAKGGGPRGVAVIPFPQCVADSRGLEYELRNHRLILGERESVANRCSKKSFSLTIQGEALLVEDFTKFGKILSEVRRDETHRRPRA